MRQVSSRATACAASILLLVSLPCGCGPSDGSPDPGDASAPDILDASARADDAADGAARQETDGGAVPGTDAAADAPVTVLPCSAIGDAGVGTWQAISPPEIPIGANGSLIPNVATNPLSAGELYVSTSQRGIFKSTDCGATWTKIDTGRNASIIDSGTAWLFALDPVTPNVLYADTYGGNPYGLYKSTNGGVDWDPLWTDGGVVAAAAAPAIPELLGIDRTDHQHIVVTIHNDCTAPHTPFCFAESNDAGATWRIVDGPPELASWVEGAAPIVLGAKTFLLGSTWAPLYLTTDDGASWKKVSDSGGVRLEQAGGFSYVGQANGIQRSHDLEAWTPLTSGVGGEITYGLVNDGQTLFVASRSQVYPGSYASSPASDGTTWTKLPSPAPLVGATDGAYSLAVDPAHHLLYSANQGSGLFRMVTK